MDLILPPDPFWLLRVEVPNAGDQVPLEWRFWYHVQFCMAKRIDAPVQEPDTQADGTP